MPIASEDLFDAMAALLSATSYTQRFAWDLEDSFARIPFPSDAGLFAEAARIGGEIRQLETFARPPSAARAKVSLAGRASGGVLAVPPIGSAFLADGAGGGSIPLQADQSLRVVDVPERAWRFAVSGYRVLPRWLLARNGETYDSAMQRAILDVIQRVEELLHWFDAADAVLAKALQQPLTRADLGLLDVDRLGPAG